MIQTAGKDDDPEEQDDEDAGHRRCEIQSMTVQATSPHGLFDRTNFCLGELQVFANVNKIGREK